MLFVLGVGLTALYSVSIGRGGDEIVIFQKQFAVAIVGLVGYFIVANIDFHTWQSTSRWIYAFMVVLLLATLLFGRTINGTKGWIGFGSWLFQPVELAKLTAVLVLGSYFARQARDLDLLRNLFQSFVLVAVLVGLIFLQPDFGSAVLLLALWFSLVLIIGVKRKYLLGLAIIGLFTFLIGWFFLFQPYQKERLKTFVSISDADVAASYNVRQATIAVGSGGLFGKGLGEGSQSQLRFLPEAETDFIFAVVAEELGFIGILVLFSFIWVIYIRLFIILRRVSDWFASFVVLGSIILLTVQFFINAGMAMGIVPVVGIPFPLLSAGGSSLLVHLILFGVLQNIARFSRAHGYQSSMVSVRH